MTGAPSIELLEADGAAALDAARDIFREYADGLGVDLAFQDFEAELAGLPGDYAPPGGYVKNIRKPRTLAATLADSDQVQILTDLAKANAKVIAQRQHAAGFWRGFGPYDSSLYGPRSMGGWVSWLGW